MNLDKLAKKLGYLFNNIALLDQALSHRSYGTSNNERLEFLGDAILGLIISLELYQRYPTAKEGELSRMRSSLVNREVLANLAIQLQLSDYLHLGMGERKSGGEKRQSILADTMEAVIGAIYLDSDMTTCHRCILHWFDHQLNHLSNLMATKDPKSELQEWVQARKLPLPIYQAIVSGKAHAQTFKIICTVEGLPYQTEGVSSSRRKAEQIAAEHYLEFLDEKDEK